eukprot:1907485-Rhodomonas_salina.1
MPGTDGATQHRVLGRGEYSLRHFGENGTSLRECYAMYRTDLVYRNTRVVQCEARYCSSIWY